MNIFYCNNHGDFKLSTNNETYELCHICENDLKYNNVNIGNIYYNYKNKKIELKGFCNLNIEKFLLYCCDGITIDDIIVTYKECIDDNIRIIQNWWKTIIYNPYNPRGYNFIESSYNKLMNE